VCLNRAGIIRRSIRSKTVELTFNTALKTGSNLAIGLWPALGDSGREPDYEKQFDSYCKQTSLSSVSHEDSWRIEAQTDR